MKTPHVHVELIKAWADGKEIEVFDEMHKQWSYTCPPQWKPTRKYRIKPEPKVIKYRLYLYKDNNFYAVNSCSNYASAEQIEKSPYFVKWITDCVEYTINNSNCPCKNN